MAKSAVFIDLDRTLLCRASGRALNKALVEEGVLPHGRSLPGDKLLYAVNDRLGENLFSMGLVRAAARVAKGWQQSQVQAAGRKAVADLTELVAPFAPQYLEAFRADGHQLVLATTTPVDLVTPFAEAMGFDAVVATTYETKDGRYTGRLYEGFVWGTGKLRAVRAWCEEASIDLDDCHACSDSVFDVPVLASVGFPHAVNPDPSLTVIATARRWPIEHWDRPPGVPSVVGLEPYHLLRPFVRSASFPYARFDISGLENIPSTGPVLLAANHRSYFDVAALALVAARVGRPVRFLGKKEIFDAPVVGIVARSIGGIPVDRGHGSDQPLRAARSGLARRRNRRRAATGHDPAWSRLLRSRSQGEDGDGPTGRIDGRRRGPDRVVGDGEGLATVGPDARRHPRVPPTEGHGPGRPAVVALSHGRGG